MSMVVRLASRIGRIAALANRPRRDRGATRAIYSYPAKFQAHLPAELIGLFSARGDLVVDPYSGGGTTGLEAQLAARLVVTSPPYKDLDVEYGLLQIQRRDLGKSKRSRVIWNLLGAPVQSKIELCGGRGATYWSRLAPALREIRRVLAPGAPAFFWTGFKTDGDRDAFVARLAEAGLPARHLVPVSLSSDRVASSRSTHHGRATGMMARDYLIGCL
jgi:DNA methylase